MWKCLSIYDDDNYFYPLKSTSNIHEIPAKMAVDVDLITQEFLDAERERLEYTYLMYSECDFYNSARIWYKTEYFQYGGRCVGDLMFDPLPFFS